MDILAFPAQPAESTLKCAECGGPINNGEPCSIYMDQTGGVLTYHKFKNTCEWHKEHDIQL